ncbi:MAG: hypothetical protein Tsb005_03910 [Gammaproteobacteria bacterium]
MSVHANPQGGVVTSGQASITQSPGITTINQSSDQAIIEWQSFNIGSGERTHFQQPSSSSVTLNRINAANGVSQIFGTLSATGHIFLVNPAGIVFGPSAKVDVAGLVATTANISNEDFLARNYQFAQDPAYATSSVINHGEISIRDGGLAALVAPGVANHGVITAKLGKIGLGAGKQFTLDLYGDELIQFTAGSAVNTVARDSEGNALSHAVHNTGTLAADGGYIQLTASTADGLLDHVINMEGTARANTVSTQGGRIVLGNGSESNVRVAGLIEARGDDAGEIGGQVQVLGQAVRVETATLDVSGEAGGGTINVGGNYQGEGPLPNAETTYIGPESRLYANAISDGDGGEVIVWANGRTDFYGLIEARGGALSGDGGFVEVSGKEVLVYGGTVDLRAPNGEFGDLLLDPYNLTIQDTSSQTIGQNNGTFTSFTSNANDSVLSASVLNSALELANVLVQTGTGGAQAGDITVAAGTVISWAASTTLTLLAANTVSVEGSIVNTGSGNLNIIAQGVPTLGSTSATINIIGSIVLNDGDVNFFYNPLSPFPNGDAFINITTTNGAFTPYILINNAAQLQAIGGSSNAFALSGDIDLNGVNFTSLSNFGGILDGGALLNAQFQDGTYIIRDLNINQSTTDNVGLFAQTTESAIIRNLLLSDVTVVGEDNVGAVVGTNLGTIDNVHVTGTVTGRTTNIGGLVGLNSDSVTGRGILNNVSFAGSVNSTLGPINVGGLVGTSRGVISQAFVTGEINTGLGGQNVGGLVGEVVDSNLFGADGLVTDVFVDNVIRLTSTTSVGGVFGSIDDSPIISQAGSASRIIDESGSVIGGFAGLVQGGTISDSYSLAQIDTPGALFVGGFIAGASNTTINNTYAAVTGNAFSTNNSAPFIDINGANLVVNNSFYNSDIHTFGADTSGAVGITTAQMQQQSTFTDAGWDFTNTWGIVDGVSFPYLQVQNSLPIQFISGFVTDGGSPVVGATVTLIQNTLISPDAITGADGFYFIHILGENRFPSLVLDNLPRVVNDEVAIVALTPSDSSSTELANTILRLPSGAIDVSGIDLEVDTIIVNDNADTGISSNELINLRGTGTNDDLLFTASGSTITLGGNSGSVRTNINFETTADTLFNLVGATFIGNDSDFTFNGDVNISGASSIDASANASNPIAINFNGTTTLADNASLSIVGSAQNETVSLLDVIGQATSSIIINTSGGSEVVTLGSSTGGVRGVGNIFVLHSGVGGASTFTFENFSDIALASLGVSGEDDTLILRGNANSATHELGQSSLATSGSIIYDDVLISYGGLNALRDELVVADRILNFNIATPTLGIEATGGFNSPVAQDLMANRTAVNLEFVDPSDNIIYNLVANSDNQVNIISVNNSFAGNLIINALGGNDDFNLFAVPVNFALQLDGGADFDSINVPTNLSRNGSPVTITQTIVNLANRTINSDIGTLVNAFSNIEQINANTNAINNTLIGDNVNTIFDLSSQNIPIANGITLNGFSNIIGGNANDTFLFGNAIVPGFIDGGAGYDTLNFENYDGAGITVSLTGIGGVDGYNGTVPSNIAGGFFNINNLVGTNLDAPDVLVGLPEVAVLRLSDNFITYRNRSERELGTTSFEFFDNSASPVIFLDGRFGGSVRGSVNGLTGREAAFFVLRFPEGAGRFFFNNVSIGPSLFPVDSFLRDVQLEKTAEYTSPEQAKQNVCTANGGNLGMPGCASIVIDGFAGQQAF